MQAQPQGSNDVPIALLSEEEAGGKCRTRVRGKPEWEEEQRVVDIVSVGT